MGDDERKNEENEYDAKTFLYIRTNPADDGSTPLPAGLPFWISPDITIKRPGGGPGDEAYSGENTNVEVIVTNAGGIDAKNAYVEVFIADPSTAFTPQTATKIGDQFIDVLGHNIFPASIPWTPTDMDTGHKCLLARVCLSSPPDCYVNHTIFDVVGDRHVAQRNVHIIQLSKNSQSFGFIVVNPFNEQKGQFALKVKEVKVGKRDKQIEQALGFRYARFSEIPVEAIGLELGNRISHQTEFSKGGKVGKKQIGIIPIKSPSYQQKTQRLEMEPGEQYYAKINLRKNPDAREDDINIIQIQQIDIKTERIVGGLWLVIVN